MSELRGVGIGLGVAQGPIVRMAEALPAPENTPSTAGAEAERSRVRDAVSIVANELNARGEAAGGSAQEVLEAQAMIAEDPTLQDEVDTRIDAGATAEWAVHDAFAGFRATLEAVGGYLGERAADLDDIAQRVLARLRGSKPPAFRTRATRSSWSHATSPPPTRHSSTSTRCSRSSPRTAVPHPTPRSSPGRRASSRSSESPTETCSPRARP